MNKTEVQLSLERQLRTATGAWNRLPILIALTKELNQRNPRGVHQYAVEALALAKELNDPFWIACSLCAGSIPLMIAGHHREGLRKLQEASTIFASIHDFRMKGEVDFMIARTHISLKEFTEGMKLLPDILNTFKGLQIPYFIIGALCSIGDIYRFTGDWATSIHYYRRASKMLVHNRGKAGDPMVYHRLAASYRALGDSNRYRAYMFKSLVASRESRHTPGIAIAIANIGNSYLDQQLFDKAEKYVRKSGQIYHQLGYTHHEALAWARLGTICEHRGEYSKALRYYQKGLSLARTGERGIILGNVYENFGRLCVKMGQNARGFAYMHKAVAIVEKFGQPDEHYRIYEALSAIYEMAGDTQNALKCYKRSAEIKKEYLEGQKVLDAAYTEMKMRFQPLVRQLKKEQSQNKDLRKIIEQKESQLRLLTLQMVRDEEEKNPTKKRGPAQKEAGVQNNGSGGPSNNWETFTQHFHKVHHQFYTDLVHRYPALTATEIKVCCLIRIGLCSKEIASILCISRRTVDSHRARIHKKLPLPLKASLAKFIAGL